MRQVIAWYRGIPLCDPPHYDDTLIGLAQATMHYKAADERMRVSFAEMLNPCTDPCLSGLIALDSWWHRHFNGIVETVSSALLREIVTQWKAYALTTEAIAACMTVCTPILRQENIHER